MSNTLNVLRGVDDVSPAVDLYQFGVEGDLRHSHICFTQGLAMFTLAPVHPPIYAPVHVPLCMSAFEQLRTAMTHEFAAGQPPAAEASP